MCEDAHRAIESRHEFERYRAIRSTLWFAEASLEAFVNAEMRIHLEREATSEAVIFKRLRHESFRDKINKWPSEIAGRQVDVDPAASGLFDLFDGYHSLRNALTHSKDRDHSIYARLDKVQPSEIVQSVATTLVLISTATRGTFPYWTLGWNFVGLDRDDTHPVLLGVDQFRHSLRRLELIPTDAPWLVDVGERWMIKNMSSLDAFQALKLRLDTLRIEIEPWFEIVPGRGCPPRLTRRWWDAEFILSTVPSR